MGCAVEAPEKSPDHRKVAWAPFLPLGGHSTGLIALTGLIVYLRLTNHTGLSALRRPYGSP